MKLRLFIGITAPPEWKRALTEWRAGIQSRFSNSFGRWTPESNLHLTLRFFGNVEEHEVVDIAKQLQKVAANSAGFSVTAGLLGCFPSPSRPRILWLGFGCDTERLLQLESEIRVATAGFGQPPENRLFHPHLTLARLKNPTRMDRETIAELVHKPPAIEVGRWRVSEVELIRSEPGPEGSAYTTVAAIPLA